VNPAFLAVHVKALARSVLSARELRHIQSTLMLAFPAELALMLVLFRLLQMLNKHQKTASPYERRFFIVQ
jgi:choline-glycine betaine transporter